VSELLTKLQADEKYHTEHLSEVKRQIDAERKRILKDKFGIEPGCVVKDKAGKEFLVVGLEMVWRTDTKPWVRGKPKKKDGGFSKSIQHVYSDWEIVSSPQPSQSAEKPD
jgi:hypothetical protein